MNKNFKPVLFVAILTLSNAVSAQVPAAPAAPAAKPPVAAPAAAPAPAAPAAPVAAPAAAPAPAPVAAPAAPAAPVAAPVSAPAPAAMPVEAPVAVPAPAPVAAPAPAPVPVAAPVVVSEAPAVTEAAPAAPAPAGMWGIVVKFDGSLPTIGLAYATATTKTALNLGYNRKDFDGKDGNGDKIKADQTITISPSFACDLGEAILPYGVGIVGAVILDNRSDPDKKLKLEWNVTPNFYTKAWLVDKTVSFGASMGPKIGIDANKDMTIGLGTSGMLTFYFM